MDITSAATYDTMPAMPAMPSAPVSQPSGETATVPNKAVAGTNKNAELNEKPGAVSSVKIPGQVNNDKDKQSLNPMNQEMMEKAIEQINRAISTFNREMHISVHEKTRQIMVKVMDTESNKVIRELPPEKVLDAFARTLELAGILVDKKS